MSPTLIIFGGLPATGKTTIALLSLVSARWRCCSRMRRDSPHRLSTRRSPWSRGWLARWSRFANTLRPSDGPRVAFASQRVERANDLLLRIDGKLERLNGPVMLITAPYHPVAGCAKRGCGGSSCRFIRQTQLHVCRQSRFNGLPIVIQAGVRDREQTADLLAIR